MEPSEQDVIPRDGFEIHIEITDQFKKEKYKTWWFKQRPRDGFEIYIEVTDQFKKKNIKPDDSKSE